MKIAIIGTGYVGLVTGACLSDFGMEVTCVDMDIEKIYQLSHGIVPIYEPGLEEYVNRNVNNKRLTFTSDTQSAIENNKGKTLAILGMTFKPRTDDMREAPSITILTELAKLGARFQIFDPQWQKEGPQRFSHLSNVIFYCTDEYDACTNADGLVILTEWNQFRDLDMVRLKEIMKDHYFFDYRNIYERKYVESFGFIYDCVGR